jgi:hypothetical protein
LVAGGHLKLTLLAIGVAIGATWPDLFLGWRTVLLVIFLIGAVYTGYVRFAK